MCKAPKDVYVDIWYRSGIMISAVKVLPNKTTVNKHITAPNKP